MMPRQRFVVLAGALAVLIAWALLRLAPALVRESREARWQLEDRTRLLARSRGELARRQLLLDSAGSVRQALADLAPRILSGSEAQADDDLAERITALAAQANTRVTAVRPVRDSTEAGHLRRVTAHLTFDADIRGVMDLLRALAGDDVILTAAGLRIVAAEPGGPAPEGPEILRVEMTVRAWRMAGGEQP